MTDSGVIGHRFLAGKSPDHLQAFLAS